jgi:peptidyl-tRNA hydrolase, PTH1 family
MSGKFLIAGLGNIGDEYAHTRHNIGFDILDGFAATSKISFDKNKRHAFVASTLYKGRSLVLIKPTTYMNLSGKAVNYWLQKEKVPVENLLIIVDDIALPFGTIRLRPKGGDGGHNGLTSIIEYLGHENFARLRFGIDSQFHKGQQVDYVLSPWDKDEEKALPPRIELAGEMIKSFVTMGLERTMNAYNKR